MPQDHHFMLEDAEGVSHKYTMTPIPYEEGMPVCLQIYAMLAGPVGRLVANVLQGELADKLEDAGGLAGVLDNPDVGEGLITALRNIDWAAIGSDLSAQLGSQKALAVCRTLLKYTTRDGHDLDSDAALDMAYTLNRNYWEHNLAVWEVIKYHRFFPQWSTFAGSNEQPEKMDLETLSKGSHGRARVN